MIIRSAGRRHCWSSKSKKRIGARVCCAAMAPARYRRGWAAFESDIVFAQADVFLLAAPGFLIGQQALDALGFSAQALFGPPQPVLMVRQAVGEISHVERPLFQADDLVPQLLETHSNHGEPASR